MSTILITGANRGLGLGLVKEYANDGWKVIATSRNPNNSNDLTDLVNKKGNNIEIHHLDVEDLDSISALSQDLKNTPIDILVNVAGYYGKKIVSEPGGLQEFGSTDYEDWQRIIKVNIFGPMKICETLISNIELGNHKKIITLSSIIGSIGGNDQGMMYAYRVSKAGVNAIMRSMAIDLKDKDIICIPLHPGWVRTDMGGPNADIDTKTSVVGMKNVIDNLSIKDSGRYMVYDGSELPW
tara:strand:+ start:560 stop:1276 length:717 start_codon:yes stop_codon:yes gene_type:complete